MTFSIPHVRLSCISYITQVSTPSAPFLPCSEWIWPRFGKSPFHAHSVESSELHYNTSLRDNLGPLDLPRVLQQTCVVLLSTPKLLLKYSVVGWLPVVLSPLFSLLFHSQMSKVWNELKPKLSCLFVGSSNMPTPPLSPPEGNFFSN